MDHTSSTPDLFSETYEESRRKFIESLRDIQQTFPDAKHHSHVLASDPSVSIDWIMADPPLKKKMFVLTTGQHGIEGYTGAAILQLFILDYLPRFDPGSTGLLLVHAINPWGMKHRRKVNNNNVDLNRNFTMDLSEFDPNSNQSARKIENLIYPHCIVQAGFFNRLWFILRVLVSVLRIGRKDFMVGSLMGQYCYPDGMFYGGREHQEETRVMKELYKTTMQNYPQLLHLDMHTGYGPRYQISLVNSTREPTSSTDLKARFKYPLVQKTDADEFYSMNGDMIDYMHRLKAGNPHVTRFYSSSFEFGTYGDSIVAGIRSLRTMVFEMQARRFGVKDESSERWITKQFAALYDVREPRWVSKAIADARQAFDGIFKAEGFLK